MWKAILIIKSGTINAPISRKEDSIIERCISKDGAPSITHYEVIEEIEINNINVASFDFKVTFTQDYSDEYISTYILEALDGKQEKRLLWLGKAFKYHSGNYSRYCIYFGNCNSFSRKEICCSNFTPCFRLEYHLGA